MELKKILVLVPAVTASGGIKNYFQVLKGQFSLPVEYMERGARTWPYRKSFFRELIRAWSDLQRFKKRIAEGDIKLVQTSTSLGLFAIIRDGLFVYFAKKKNIRTIVFYRGWDKEFEKKLEKYLLFLFRFFFFRADEAIVLASDFRNKLIEWGFKKPIHLETTIIDEKLLENTDLASLRNTRIQRKNNHSFRLLFLARIEIPKGIRETISVYQIIKEKNPGLKVSLDVVGDGRDLENVKESVKAWNDPLVHFHGYLEGEDKKKILANSDAYLLPSYTEGMPNSVIEAMGFGLPVISRTVGAIPDIIKDGENGFLTSSKEPSVFADLVQKLIENPGLAIKIQENNYNKALQYFTTSKVKDRLENIYRHLIQ